MLPGSLLNPGSVFTERQVQFLLREVLAHGIRAWQGLANKGLSNKSRKSKITPVRINSGRGEIVKIGLVRQPLVHYVFIRLPAFYGAGNPDDYLPSSFLTSAATVAPL